VWTANLNNKRTVTTKRLHCCLLLLASLIIYIYMSVRVTNTCHVVTCRVKPTRYNTSRRLFPFPKRMR